jgi:hypothetical protein
MKHEFSHLGWIFYEADAGHEALSYGGHEAGSYLANGLLS